MLRRLKTLWCERHGHQFREVGRVYEGPAGQVREVVLEACRICGLKRDRPSGEEGSAASPVLSDQARLDFLAKSRRRALRRTKRKRGQTRKET
jgi:hypothetical protein